MSFDAGAITGSIDLNRSPMSAALRGARTELRGFQRATRGIATAIKGVLGPVGLLLSGAGIVIGVSKLKSSISDAMGEIDNLSKTASKLGIGTEELGGLRHAADLTGNSVQALDLGLQRMVRRVSEAAQGTGEAQSALAELGLDAAQLASLSPDEQFKAIADAMQQVESQGDRVRIGFKIFDSEGVGLINTMKGGSEAVEALMQDAEDLGIAFSGVDANQIEQANDALNRAGQVIQGGVNAAAIALAPILTALTNKFTEAATEGEGFGGVVVNAVESVATGIAKAADVLSLFKAAWFGAQAGAAFAIGGIIKGMTFLQRKIGDVLQWVWDTLQPLLDFLPKGMADAVRGVGDGLLEFRRQAIDAADQVADGVLEEADRRLKLADDAFADFQTGASSKKISEFFDNARRDAEEAARAVDGAADDMNGSFDSINANQLEAIEDSLSSLRQEVERFGLSDLQIRLLDFEALGGVTPKQVAEFRQEIEKLRGLQAGETLDELRFELDTLGLDEVEQRMAALRREGLLNPDELKEARELIEKIDSTSRAEDLLQSIESPAEQFAESLAELRDLRERGLLDDTQVERLTARAREDAFGQDRLAKTVFAGSAEAQALAFDQGRGGGGRKSVDQQQVQEQQTTNAKLDDLIRAVQQALGAPVKEVVGI